MSQTPQPTTDPAASEKNIQKHTLNLRRGDFDYLRQLATHSATDASTIIRQLVAKAVDDLRAAAAHENQPKIDIDL